MKILPTWPNQTTNITSSNMTWGRNASSESASSNDLVSTNDCLKTTKSETLGRAHKSVLSSWFQLIQRHAEVWESPPSSIFSIVSTFTPLLLRWPYLLIEACFPSVYQWPIAFDLQPRWIYPSLLWYLIDTSNTTCRIHAILVFLCWWMAPSFI